MRWWMFAFSALIALHRLKDISHQTYSRAGDGSDHILGWIFVAIFWLALIGLWLRVLILRRALQRGQQPLCDQRPQQWTVGDGGDAHYAQDNPRMTVIPPAAAPTP